MKINNIFLTQTKYIIKSEDLLNLDYNYFAEIIADNELYKFVISAVNLEETMALIEKYFEKKSILKRQINLIKPVKSKIN